MDQQQQTQQQPDLELIADDTQAPHLYLVRGASDRGRDWIRALPPTTAPGAVTLGATVAISPRHAHIVVGTARLAGLIVVLA